MTGRRLTPIVLATAALVLIGVFALLPASGREQGAPPPAPRPTDSTWPLAYYSAPSSPAAASLPGPPGTIPPTSAPAVSSPVATAPGSSAATPAPFVQTFAAQPGARTLPVLPSPTAPLEVPVNVDGCDHSYGTRAQCVPWVFPPGSADKCAWLAAHGYLDTPLIVAGRDRQHLDPDADGIACHPR